MVKLTGDAGKRPPFVRGGEGLQDVEYRTTYPNHPEHGASHAVWPDILRTIIAGASRQNRHLHLTNHRETARTT